MASSYLSNYITDRDRKESISVSSVLENVINNTNSSLMVNDHTITALQHHCKPFKSTKLITSSIATNTPLAQNIADVYHTYVLQYDDAVTINDFVSKSNTLTMLSRSRNSNAFNVIREHLSCDLKYFGTPFHSTMYQYADKKHSMVNIMQWISVIHANSYILKTVSQIDVVFLQKAYDSINTQYFDTLGTVYDTSMDHKSIKAMMRAFNRKVGDSLFKRCVVLIQNDDVYIFDPKQNSSLPPEIDNITFPWICNTKFLIIPDQVLSIDDDDILCVSIHRHFNDGKIQYERSYIFYDGRYTRVFKHSLRSLLRTFCVDDEQRAVAFDWDEEIMYTEFIDYEYDLFVMALFSDLSVMKPSLKSYYMVKSYDNKRWNQLLCKYFHLQQSFSPMDYYHYINNKISTYYRSLGIYTKDDEFISYILAQEMEEETVEDNLGVNASVNDCVLLNFDESFPLNGQCQDRERCIFMFLQQIYLFGMPSIS